MSIEVKCTGCGQMLRVQEENAGKQARCPKCQATFTIPGGASGTDPLGGQQTTPQSSYPQSQSPLGQQPQQPFGQQAPGQFGQHQPGQQQFGQQSQNPFGDKPAAAGQNPYASPQGSYPQMGGRSYRQPHRGGQILTFGILGLVCCGLFGIAAWVMGNEDLKKMDAGIMDPTGRGTTQAGRVIGIICVVLMVISVVLNVIVIAAGGLAGV